MPKKQFLDKLRKMASTALVLSQKLEFDPFSNAPYFVDKSSLLERYHQLEIFKNGSVTLKNGLQTPVYFDFRDLISSLDAMVSLIQALFYEMSSC